MSSHEEERRPLTAEAEGNGSGGGRRRALLLCCALLPLVGAAIAVRWLAAGSLGFLRPAPPAAGPSAARALSDRQCYGEGRTGAPVDDLHVHYLMMAVDSVPHAGIWAEFFAGAAPGSYSAWMHCKEPQKCKADMARANLTAFKVVPPVYNKWCDDLVSPVLQLLRTALAAQVSPPGVSEKFVILSESTLPLKPFRVIQSELGKHPEASDICFYPTDEWAKSGNHSNVAIPAHSNWIVFSRADAETMCDRFPPPSPDNPIRVPDVMNMSYWDFWSPYVCLDELSLFWGLFGVIRLDRARTSYPGVGPVRSNYLHPQGCCQTMTWFGDPRTNKTVRESLQGQYAEHALVPKTFLELADAPGSDVRMPMEKREMVFSIAGLGPAGLRILRRSPFLFARKFTDNASLPGYAGVMFA